MRLQLIDEVDSSNLYGGDGVRAAWRLISDLKFKSDKLGIIYIVPTGFDTDLASVPRIILASSFLGVANKASVLHDHAYVTKTLSKHDADELFLEAMEVDNIANRDLLYEAVKLFGNPK